MWLRESRFLWSFARRDGDYRIVESEFREHCIRDVGVGYYVDACGCEFVDESFYSLGYFICVNYFLHLEGVGVRDGVNEIQVALGWCLIVAGDSQQREEQGRKQWANSGIELNTTAAPASSIASRGIGPVVTPTVKGSGTVAGFDTEGGVFNNYRL